MYSWLDMNTPTFLFGSCASKHNIWKVRINFLLTFSVFDLYCVCQINQSRMKAMSAMGVHLNGNVTRQQPPQQWPCCFFLWSCRKEEKGLCPPRGAWETLTAVHSDQTEGFPGEAWLLSACFFAPTLQHLKPNCVFSSTGSCQTITRTSLL